MLHLSIQLSLFARSISDRAIRSDRGEGVISTAIAVLVIALLGAAMWVAFNAMFTNTTTQASTQVGTIGS